MKKIERDVHGRRYSFETGRVAKQAHGSCLIQSGDSVVLVTACIGEERGEGFLPLTIDYVEKNYAAGKIPGGFFKREGKLSEREILISRLIDRPCRPLFPEGFSKEIQVVATVLSADANSDTDVLAVMGASAALSLSELPFEGPIAAVRVARVKGQFLINPDLAKLAQSELSFIVAGTRTGIVMVEGGADEVPEEIVLEALFFAHQELQVFIDIQEELVAACGTPKVAFDSATTLPQIPPNVRQDLISFLRPRLEGAIMQQEKGARRDAIRFVRSEAKAHFFTEPESEKTWGRTFDSIYENELFDATRNLAFDKGVRLDGRDLTTVRPISTELGFLPRTHGSALFTRGETQAIVVVTLGTEQEAQKLDNLAGETEKLFLLHYNFPPFSVGEVRPMRGPGRREIGHGALAERAVKAVLPSLKEFPYVVRVVSEITESNGSSSMATVCGASLALMDAGVPVKAPVAGVAMGLLVRGEEHVILTDILGDEDHLGDMDFKVCGTEKGITALQMDLKIKSLSRVIMEKALRQAQSARLHILGRMESAISITRTSLSKYAPKIVTIKVPVAKIRDIIGSGGKTIRSITESCGVKMEVNDDGIVSISSNNDDNIKQACSMIESLIMEPEVGKIYKGVVKRIAVFGAFVEFIPGIDGLVHISQLDERKVHRVNDVVQEGDEVWVKVLEVDSQGRVRLSIKDAIAERSAGNQ
jgi:polyribonucleotide nucleotidyltransferase